MNSTKEAPSNGTAPQATIDTIPMPAKLVLELHAHLNRQARREIDELATGNRLAEGIEQSIQAFQAKARSDQAAAAAAAAEEKKKAEAEQAPDAAAKAGGEAKSDATAKADDPKSPQPAASPAKKKA